MKGNAYFVETHFVNAHYDHCLSVSYSNLMYSTVWLDKAETRQ